MYIAYHVCVYKYPLLCVSLKYQGRLAGICEAYKGNAVRVDGRSKGNVQSVGVERKNETSSGKMHKVKAVTLLLAWKFYFSPLKPPLRGEKNDSRLGRTDREGISRTYTHTHTHTHTHTSSLCTLNQDLCWGMKGMCRRCTDEKGKRRTSKKAC